MDVFNIFDIRSLSQHIIILLVLLSGIIIPQSATAQDPDFTQIFTTPLYLNPAMAGNYDGNFRLGLVYRDQWAGMINDPFRSYALSGDVKIDLGEKNKRNKDYLAGGLFVMSDKVSSFDFSTNIINLAAAFHKYLGLWDQTYLSAGISAGMNQKNFTYENFSFQDQFNGVDGYTFSTDEQLPRNNHAYFDLNIGLNLNTQVNRNWGFNTGFAIFHVATPNISFYQDEPDDEIEDLIRTNDLSRRISAYATVNMQLYPELMLSPGIIWINQGEHTQFRIGTGSRFELSDVKGSAFHLGGWFRFARNLENIGLNTFSILAGFEYQKLLVGLSYDLSVEDISTYTAGQHIFEISFSYIGRYEDDSIFCPRF